MDILHCKDLFTALPANTDQMGHCLMWLYTVTAQGDVSAGHSRTKASLDALACLWRHEQSLRQSQDFLSGDLEDMRRSGRACCQANKTIVSSASASSMLCNGKGQCGPSPSQRQCLQLKVHPGQKVLWNFRIRLPHSQGPCTIKHKCQRYGAGCTATWRAFPYVDWLSFPEANWCEKSGRRPVERADGIALGMALC